MGLKKVFNNSTLRQTRCAVTAFVYPIITSKQWTTKQNLYHPLPKTRRFFQETPIFPLFPCFLVVEPLKKRATFSRHRNGGSPPICRKTSAPLIDTWWASRFPGFHQATSSSRPSDEGHTAVSFSFEEENTSRARVKLKCSKTSKVVVFFYDCV